MVKNRKNSKQKKNHWGWYALAGVAVMITGCLVMTVISLGGIKDETDWETTKSIALQTHQPSPHIVKIIGCSKDNSACPEPISETKVTVYADVNSYIMQYRHKARALARANGLHHIDKDIYRVVRVIRSSAELNGSVDLTKIETTLSTPEVEGQPVTLNFVYFHALTEGLLELVDQGKVVVYDNESGEMIKTITIHDVGVKCGPTCGHRGKEYFLPDGRLFYALEWVS
jgi:hypothetical protein